MRHLFTTAILPLLLVGCDPFDVGDVTSGQDTVNPGSRADAGARGDGSAAADDDGGTVAANCDDPPDILPSGGPAANHNVGLPCLNCHDGNGGPPQWTAAGTIYDPEGNPLPGATLHLVDGLGNDVTIVSALNGNFHTADPITFPVTVRASLCPNEDRMMAQQANEGMANCNQAGCHDANRRIVLP